MTRFTLIAYTDTLMIWHKPIDDHPIMIYDVVRNIEAIGNGGDKALSTDWRIS